MKISEMQEVQVADYLRLDDYREEDIKRLMDTAKAFIRSYTGLTDEEIDTHEDFYIVVLVLCQDMYDNRCMYVDKGNLNKVVETILGMHCVNLL